MLDIIINKNKLKAKMINGFFINFKNFSFLFFCKTNCGILKTKNKEKNIPKTIVVIGIVIWNKLTKTGKLTKK